MSADYSEEKFSEFVEEVRPVAHKLVDSGARMRNNGQTTEQFFQLCISVHMFLLCHILLMYLKH
jgi:hypothetical protein